MKRVLLFNFREKLGYEEISLERKKVDIPESLKVRDVEIEENINFEYRVVLPSDGVAEGLSKRYSRVIILFHGLNERSWDKYIPWANYLSTHTRVPVLLFPIAFHINRSPHIWSEPRAMQSLVNIQKEHNNSSDRVYNNQNLTFVNYALSTRIKASPYRFYLGGRETVFNVCQLISEIKSGLSPIFTKKCKVDIFSYSIGSLLSQVLLMANPFNYFPDTKLFMFCGGALFSEMNGNSRMIMDRDSFEMLNYYYSKKFINDNRVSYRAKDSIYKAFVAHIDKEVMQRERENFYKKNRNRIKAISLKKDIVIPTSGIKHALGSTWKSCLKELDFPFKYSHEAPFPAIEKGGSLELEYWFHRVFTQAVQFLK